MQAEYLLDKLKAYSESDFYPLHMPGHKRRSGGMGDPFAIDITEIEGFDNLHHAEGILLEAQQRAARLYGAEETYYLVNGSTCGILAAVSSCVPRGGRILMARNCHKAAYHAVLLNGLHAEYLYPAADMERGINGSIRAEDVEAALAGQICEEKDALAGQKGEAEAALAGQICEEKDALAGRKNEAEAALTGPVQEMETRKRQGGTPDGCAAEKPRISAVLITSPTYDGVVSDIRRIADIVHAAGAVLIVDEAHGAHFAMHPYFPESAIACGADLVINSLHKTMMSLTQTALLHVGGKAADSRQNAAERRAGTALHGGKPCANQEKDTEKQDTVRGEESAGGRKNGAPCGEELRVDRKRLQKYLGVYQTSSPSYVLMAGMDACVRQMEERGAELFDAFTERLERMRRELQGMRALHLVDGTEAELDAFAFDRSKVLISTERAGISGPELSTILRRNYHLEAEMEAERYVTAIMTVADTEEGFARLTRALLETDAHLVQRIGADAQAGEREESCHPFGECELPQQAETDRQEASCRPSEECVSPQQAKTAGQEASLHSSGERGPLLQTAVAPRALLTIAEADALPRRRIRLRDSAGCISAEFVYLYPPGIPLLVPGEEIADGLPEQLAYYKEIGLKLQGMEDYSGEQIYIVETVSK